jgi:hypothetical protein
MPNTPKTMSVADASDSCVNTAFLLAELHTQNELLYALVNKGAKNSPVPDRETITSLYHFFLSVLRDPATDRNSDLPVRAHTREDGTCDDMTLLEDIRADGHY